MKLDLNLVKLVIQEVLLHKTISADEMNINLNTKNCYLLPKAINEIAEDVVKSLENLENER